MTRDKTEKTEEAVFEALEQMKVLMQGFEARLKATEKKAQQSMFRNRFTALQAEAATLSHESFQSHLTQDEEMELVRFSGDLLPPPPPPQPSVWKKIAPFMVLLPVVLTLLPRK